MENFVSEPQILNTFAKHYKTGEVIPKDLVIKIKESATFMSGTVSMRQLAFGYLDMTWHGNNPNSFDINEVEAKSDVTRMLYPEVPGISISSAFSHIFQAVILQDIIVINGQKYLMRMLMNSSVRMA